MITAIKKEIQQLGSPKRLLFCLISSKLALANMQREVGKRDEAERRPSVLEDFLQVHIR